MTKDHSYLLRAGSVSEFDIVTDAYCERRESELAALGVAVERHTFPGAGHAWESSAPQHETDSPYIVGCEIEYDAHGFASVDGQRLSDAQAGTPRSQRLAARVVYGNRLQPCVRRGYTVGRNEAAMRWGHEILLAFLEKHFHLARTAPMVRQPR